MTQKELQLQVVLMKAEAAQLASEGRYNEAATVLVEVEDFQKERDKLAQKDFYQIGWADRQAMKLLNAHL